MAQITFLLGSLTLNIEHTVDYQKIATENKF